MSCCGGKCGCGDACKCGNGCQGGKMYPETSFSDNSKIIVGGVAPRMKYFEDCENGVATENDSCQCGANCTCNPCTCKGCK